MNILLKMDKCLKEIEDTKQEIANVNKNIKEIELILNEPNLTNEDKVRWIISKVKTIFIYFIIFKAYYRGRITILEQEKLAFRDEKLVLLKKEEDLRKKIDEQTGIFKLVSISYF